MKITRNQLRKLIKEELTHLLEQDAPIQVPNGHAGIPSPVEPGSMRRYRAKDAQGNIWVIDVDQSGPQGSRGSTRGWGWKLESLAGGGPIILWDKEWSENSWVELDPRVGLKIWGEPADGSEAFSSGEEIWGALETDSDVFGVVNTHYDMDPAHMFYTLARKAEIPEINI